MQKYLYKFKPITLSTLIPLVLLEKMIIQERPASKAALDMMEEEGWKNEKLRSHEMK
jgi:hypothetical protein